MKFCAFQLNRTYYSLLQHSNTELVFCQQLIDVNGLGQAEETGEAEEILINIYPSNRN